MCEEPKDYGMARCAVCTWCIFWIALTIYWPIQFHDTTEPPKYSFTRIPPTLSYKTLLITKTALIYDGTPVNDTRIYFHQVKCPTENEKYYIWQP